MIRRWLPYVVVIGGVAIWAAPFSAGDRSFLAGQLFTHLLGAGMVLGGGMEIAKRFLPGRRYLPYVIAVVAGIALLNVVNHAVGRGPQTAYPAKFKADFIRGCERTGGTASACGCLINWFESNKSMAEFNADVAALKTGATPADVAQAATTCAASAR